MIQLIVSAGGTVNWDNTRDALVHSVAFCDGLDDFGPGQEHQAQCPGCARTLPTAMMHLDHILPQHGYEMAIMQDGTPVRLLDSLPPHAMSMQFSATCNGGTVSIFRLGAPLGGGGGGPVRHIHSPRLAALAAQPYYRPPVLDVRQVLHTADVWRCNLENLQWLCMGCNTAKGATTFAAWIAQPAPPNTFKHVGGPARPLCPTYV